MFHVYLRELYSSFVEWNILEISVISSWSIMLFKSLFSLLIFCLVSLHVMQSDVLKFPTIIVDYFSIQFCQFLFHMFWHFVMRYIHVYNYYISWWIKWDYFEKTFSWFFSRSRLEILEHFLRFVLVILTLDPPLPGTVKR